MCSSCRNMMFVRFVMMVVLYFGECIHYKVSLIHFFSFTKIKKEYILQRYNNNIAFFSQASWGRLEMKPERNKFKVQAH